MWFTSAGKIYNSHISLMKNYKKMSIKFREKYPWRLMKLETERNVHIHNGLNSHLVWQKTVTKYGHFWGVQNFHLDTWYFYAETTSCCTSTATCCMLSKSCRNCSKKNLEPGSRIFLVPDFFKSAPGLAKCAVLF